MIAKVIIYGGLIMRAIVLCGGKGEKIWPYNEKNQKSCLPVGNTPNILRIVEQLESFHINDIVLLTGYLEQQVKYALRKKKSVKYVSAYSENMARVILEVAQEDQDFLVYYGDIYAEDEDLRRMLLSYQENGNSALLNRCQGDFHTTDYICAMADEKIYAYYGRPRKHYVNARSAGIFIVKSDVLEYVRYAFQIFVSAACPKMNFISNNVCKRQLKMRKVYMRSIRRADLSILISHGILWMRTKHIVSAAYRR